MKQGVKWTALLGLLVFSVAVSPMAASADQGGFSSAINNIWYVEDSYYLIPVMGTTWYLYYDDTSVFPPATVTETLVITTDVRVDDIGASVYCYTSANDGWLYFYTDTITGDNRYFAAIDGPGGVAYFALEPGGARLTGAYLYRTNTGVEYTDNYITGDRIAGPAAPAAPSLVLDTCGAVVTLNWNDLVNSQGYYLYFEPAAPHLPYDGTFFQFDGEFAGVMDVGKRTSLTFVLPEGACFYVGIQAYNEGGKSPVSNIEAFYIQ